MHSGRYLRGILSLGCILDDPPGTPSGTPQGPPQAPPEKSKNFQLHFCCILANFQPIGTHSGFWSRLGRASLATRAPRRPTESFNSMVRIIITFPLLGCFAGIVYILPPEGSGEREPPRKSMWCLTIVRIPGQTLNGSWPHKRLNAY